MSVSSGDVLEIGEAQKVLSTQQEVSDRTVSLDTMTSSTENLHEKEEFSVIVVGAGVTGLLLALNLARRGVNVTVLEKRPGCRQPRRKGVLLHPRALEALAVQGVASKLVAGGTVIRHAGLCINRSVNVCVPLVRSASLFDFCVSVDEDTLMASIESELAKHQVVINYGCNVKAVYQDANSDRMSGGSRSAPNFETWNSEFLPNGYDVTVAVELGLELITLKCRFLVGCDGVHSTVRALLELPMLPVTAPEEFLSASVILKSPPTIGSGAHGAVEVQARREDAVNHWCVAQGCPTAMYSEVAESQQLNPEHINLIHDTKGILLMAPFQWGEDVAWSVLTCRETHKELPKKTTAVRLPDPTLLAVEELLSAVLHSRVEVKQLLSSGAERISEHSAPLFYRDRIFLAGDAAHLFVPQLSLGLNLAIQDVEALGWRLERMVNGNENLGNTYNSERQLASAYIHDLVSVPADVPSCNTCSSLPANHFSCEGITSTCLDALSPFGGGVRTLRRRFERFLHGIALEGATEEGADLGAVVPGHFAVHSPPPEACSPGVSRLPESRLSLFQVFIGTHSTLVLLMGFTQKKSKKSVAKAKPSISDVYRQLKAMVDCSQMDQVDLDIDVQFQWSERTFQHLRRVSRLCAGMAPHLTQPGLRTLWILSGPSKGNTSEETIRRLAPRDLIRAISHDSSTKRVPTMVGIDPRGHIKHQLAPSLSKTAGGFLLIRPDRRLAASGEAGNAESLARAVDHCVQLGVLSS
ncbi:MAG: hypothetical protein KVP17_003399 [Porospora cf. gigantea B]|uniref:uncharacterized protein n=1 Tax=Porospora cf. gigantea B TaxID=2853592 RepID=UPI003571E5F4|nr:MAG: hypothetical protein KVP17_003399 [Porospora cf. gigantea B]